MNESTKDRSPSSQTGGLEFCIESDDPLCSSFSKKEDSICGYGSLLFRVLSDFSLSEKRASPPV